MLGGACRIGDYNLYRLIKEKFVVKPNRICISNATASGTYEIIDDMAHDKDWEPSDIWDALCSACRNCKFECYQSLMTNYNMEGVDTYNLPIYAAEGAQNYKDHRIVDDLRTRGYELPE